MTGLASRLAERPPWLVRFPHPHGDSVAGAGVLIGPRHVVTCAHVLEQQLGRPLSVPGLDLAYAEEVEIEFPFTGEPGAAGGRMRGTVVGWVPIAANASGDVALLELESPVDCTPAPLACPPALSGHRFSVHGFPHGDPTARQATGLLRGASGREGPWVQLDAESSTGWAIEVGFSGAPVFDHSREAVVGLVVMRDDPRTRTGHMLPMSYLRTLWPEVRRNCGWRLDLDTSYRTHWRPRARGSEIDSDTGEWFFTGRTEARRVIGAWLEERELAEYPILLVTGGPGSGKSALLAHSLVSADPLLAPTVPTDGPRPPTGSVDVALHLRGRTRGDVTAQLAGVFGVTAAEPLELLAAVGEFPPAVRFCVLADAVEEAASLEESLQIATLLRQLANTVRVRVLAAVRTAPSGTRRERILSNFGRSVPRIDLEDSRYLHRPDIADYVTRRLASEKGSTDRYRAYARAELAAIGEAVARSARYNFLIAQLTAGWLTRRTAPRADPGGSGWEDGLPETIGQAMDAYLDTCGPDTETVRRLLTALAYARGDGLPRSSTWLSMADALGFGVGHTTRDLETIFDSAAHYLVERADEDSGPHTYRLFHDALDQHLREECERVHHAPEAAITAALMDAVPVHDGQRDWSTADSYIRDHLSDHASAAGQLDALTTEAGYLVHATPQNLTPHLRHAQSEPARRTAAIYTTSTHLLRRLAPHGRRGLLAIDAARYGDGNLSGRLASGRLWQPRWATGGLVHPALTASVTRHGTNAVACTLIDGRPHAVCLGQLRDDAIYVWDLDSNEMRAELPNGPSPGHLGMPVVACTVIDGRPHAVTARYNDDGVRVWDLNDNVLRAELATGHSHDVGALSCTSIEGRPHALVSTQRRVRVWDLEDNTLRAELPICRDEGVATITCTLIEGRPHALLSGYDGVIHVWDLASETLRAELRTGQSGGIRALACTVIDGRPHAVGSGEFGDGALCVWDLERNVKRAELAVDEDRGAVALDCLQIDGRPHAVTAGYLTDVVRVWDLENGAVRSELRTGHIGGVRMIVCTPVRGRPHVITSGGGRGARVWDLTVDAQPQAAVSGHSGVVNALACTLIDGRPHVVSGGADRSDDTMRVWDLTADRPDNRRVVRTGGAVDALACTGIDGRPHALTSDSLSDTMQVWDLTANPPHLARAALHTGTGPVSAIACTLIDGRPHAVAGGGTTMSVWDLTAEPGQAARATFRTGHPDRVTSLACTIIDGRPHAITSCFMDETVRVWDLTAEPGQAMRTVLRTGHRRGVRALACTIIDGRPHLVTGGNFGARAKTRIWDLTANASQPARATLDSGAVLALACTIIDGRPHAVTSGFHDHPVRAWDLTTNACVEAIHVPLTVNTIAASGPLIVLGMNGDLLTLEWTRDGAQRRRPTPSDS
ncbi:trypsin-like peptidase domain-containing protein [Streptomyces sp. NPDC058251]|uniref:trypsin-like peptidase domain-containing protein n=1 Tax=Streptomyces sp. NPDC058251 TaxID=3346404 RepID=UPI0036ECEEE2